MRVLLSIGVDARDQNLLQRGALLSCVHQALSGPGRGLLPGHSGAIQAIIEDWELLGRLGKFTCPVGAFIRHWSDRRKQIALWHAKFYKINISTLRRDVDDVRWRGVLHGNQGVEE